MERVRAYVTFVVEFDHEGDWAPSRIAQEVQEMFRADQALHSTVRSFKYVAMDLSMDKAEDG